MTRKARLDAPGSMYPLVNYEKAPPQRTRQYRQQLSRAGAKVNT